MERYWLSQITRALIPMSSGSTPPLLGETGQLQIALNPVQPLKYLCWQEHWRKVLYQRGTSSFVKTVHTVLEGRPFMMFILMPG